MLFYFPKLSALVENLLQQKQPSQGRYPLLLQNIFNCRGQKKRSFIFLLFQKITDKYNEAYYSDATDLLLRMMQNFWYYEFVEPAVAAPNCSA